MKYLITLDENNVAIGAAKVKNSYVPQDGEIVVTSLDKVLGRTYDSATGVFLNTIEEARQWRDEELLATDRYMMLNDYPAQRDQAMRTYRQALRDWPNTPDFPDTRPTL